MADKEKRRQTKYNIDKKDSSANELIRTSFLIGREQNELLNELKNNSHESKSYFIRQALEKYFDEKNLRG